MTISLEAIPASGASIIDTACPPYCPMPAQPTSRAQVAAAWLTTRLAEPNNRPAAGR